MESYEKKERSTTQIEHKFFYKDNKLSSTKFALYANHNKLLMTLDEEIVYHTNDTIFVKVESDKGEENASTLTDTLIINPTKGYLLKRLGSSYNINIGVSGKNMVYTYTHDNSGNVLTEKITGWGDNLGASYTYDSKPSPFSTLKGIPDWYWTYFDVDYDGEDIYPGKNNRVEETILKSHTSEPYYVTNHYEYDEEEGYATKKYYQLNNGNQSLQSEYIYEEY